MTRKFYRIEQEKRPVGEIITRNGSAPLDQEFAYVEEILERRRPIKCTPRSQSVNMLENRDFNRVGVNAFEYGYIHELEPIGPVEARDVAWIGALQVRYSKSSRKFRDRYAVLTDDELADRYWRGQPSDQPSFEYATKNAKVISVDREHSPVRQFKFADALKEVAANIKKNADS